MTSMFENRQKKKKKMNTKQHNGNGGIDIREEVQEGVHYFNARKSPVDPVIQSPSNRVADSQAQNLGKGSSDR
jgi:hypothetical protein